MYRAAIYLQTASTKPQQKIAIESSKTTRCTTGVEVVGQLKTDNKLATLIAAAVTGINGYLMQRNTRLCILVAPLLCSQHAVRKHSFDLINVITLLMIGTRFNGTTDT